MLVDNEKFHRDTLQAFLTLFVEIRLRGDFRLLFNVWAMPAKYAAYKFAMLQGINRRNGHQAN